MSSKQNKLSTACYKGTRDFYPDDMRLRNWMFSVMRNTVLSYGYEEYDGPLIESLDIYRAKSGEEIVERQLYNFIDKGEREVAIRPEMTPTLARMVAAKSRELPRPIRWFSIPNLWRYEAPGHGRLREHWQLNVDIFGVDSIHAEIEIIRLACDILFAFNAPRESFRVKISHRKLLDNFLKVSLSLNETRGHAVSKILDKKNKISKQEFESLLTEQLDRPEEQIALIHKFLSSDPETIAEIPGIGIEISGTIKNLFSTLGAIGLQDQVEFDPSVVRGFDYYTGLIFEIFDTNPDNRRSLYGGGRYDNLIGLFSNDELSGIGFGLGDVTLENFLRTHKLLPDLNKEETVFIALMEDSELIAGMRLAESLRKENIRCEQMLDGSVKLGKQIALAEKKGYNFVLIQGKNEILKNSVNVKNLKKSEQNEIPLTELISYLKKEIES